MKKQVLVVLASGIVVLGGCWGKKQKPVQVKQDATGKEQYMPDMGMAGDAQKVAFFDDKDIAETERLILDDVSQPFSVAQAAQKVATESKVIYFDYDSSHPRADQKEVLAQLQKEVNQWEAQGYQVVFCGHSCKYHGTDMYNLALSEKRAREVAKMCNAVDMKKTKVFGVGNEQPVVVDNMSKEGQKPNRRVEVYPVAIAA